MAERDIRNDAQRLPADGDGPVPGRTSSKLIERVPVALEAYLGDARMTVGELLALEPGGIVPLGVALNAAIELRLEGTAVARGELVAVDDRFGVRLTEIAQWPD